jgi:hypothetical protein
VFGLGVGPLSLVGVGPLLLDATDCDCLIAGGKMSTGLYGASSFVKAPVLLRCFRLDV